MTYFSFDLSNDNTDNIERINNLNTYMYKNTGWIGLLEINNKDNIILPKYIEKDAIYFYYNNVNKTKILKPYPGFIYCIYDVEPETTYSLHVDLSRYIVYDAENNIIDYNMNAAFAEYTTPENAAYIHISANYSSIPNNQLLIFLYKGTKIELQSLDYSIPNFIDCNSIPLITPKSTTFFVTSKNLFNKDDPNKEIGKYIVSVGRIGDNNFYILFDYIKIKPNTTYCLSSIKTCTCFYSLFNKQFINTGGQNNVSIYYAPNSDTYKGLQITTGPLDEYIRLSFNNNDISDYYIQLEEGEERTKYADYGYTIDPIYIPAIQNNQENTELDKLIEPQDTTFFIQGKNLIDINTLLDGFYVNWISGSINNNDNYIATDKIKIKPSTEYTISSNLTSNIQYAFYDSDNKYIPNSAVNASNSTKHFTITSPESAYYIALSQSKAANSTNLLQLEEGTEATSYENYYMYIDNKYIKLDNSNQDLITPEDTTFFVTSKNLLKVDDDSLSRGYYISQINGNISENASHTTSDYISIKPNTTYTYSNIDQYYINYRYCIFDINKNYLSGGNSEEAVTFTTPNNAAYYRFSAGYKDVKNSMLEEGDQATDYEPYYKAIDPQYILSDNINKSKFPVNLPPKIYALVGYETNIYFDNLVDGYDTQYDFDVTCSIGTHLQRCFRVTPIEENVGEYPITIKVTKNDITVTKTATIYVASATAKANELIKLIILGDSTTNNGICVTKLNQNLSTDPMNIITIGTRGSNPNNHEGRSGWKYRTYFTSAGETYTDGRGDVDNPFYNETTETFDIANYFSETNFDHPDWFFINLGINDTFGYADDISLNIEIEYLNGLCDEVISQIKDFDENIKIGICLTIPPNYSQDAYGKAYKNGQTRNRYKRNNILWVANQIENYKNREDENIYLIPLNLCLDTVYNMGMEEIQVNARNTTTYFSPIANGGVHPVESGYWQCADVYTAFLKNI